MHSHISTGSQLATCNPLSEDECSRSRATRGLARYRVRADLPHKRVWTLTVWQKKTFVNGFINAEPHSDAVRKFRDWAGKGAAFVERTSVNGSIDWGSAMQKLQTPTFYYQEPGS